MEFQKRSIGNYILTKVIGSGQFGTVYQAVQKTDPTKIYAIKCIPKKKLETSKALQLLLQTEMAIMEEINHPNIMHLYDWMQTSNNYYLVLQYCNNGDMERYLNKMGKLSEEESVYFLMQIMNGFKILHEKKIMHRDVKLANFFLQNDTIIIGDFGFAKKGVDATLTKCGTPITMAPELLRSTGQAYTNKADLWSIGICFYQMLYGKPPFQAKNYEQLKEEVMVLSGKNLKFSKDKIISKECRDLLERLIEPDPEKRIPWSDFFRHKLFENYNLEKKRNFTSINQSLLQRISETSVKEEFSKNKQEPNKEIQLCNPEEMNIIQKNQSEKQEQEQILKDGEIDFKIESEIRIQENFKKITGRLVHEQKRTFFIMLSARLLRNLAKQKPTFEKIAEPLMLATCLLAKKGMLMHNQFMETLEKKQNNYNLEDYDKYTEKTQVNKILDQYKKEYDEQYIIFSEQMYTKFRHEVKSQQFQNNLKYYWKIDLKDLGQLNQGLVKLLQYFKNKGKMDGIQKNQEEEFYKGLVNFYYSINSEEKMGFVINGKEFEWSKFENELAEMDSSKFIMELEI